MVDFARSGVRTNASNKQRGYTLLETSIVLIVLSLILASCLTSYNLYIRTENQVTTTNNIDTSVQKINDYLTRNGHYPCPARLNATRADADYGLVGNCLDETQATNTCANGICIKEGETSVAPGGGAGYVCGTAGENGVVTLSAPAGMLFTGASFASYGTPNGVCNSYTVGGCNATTSTAIVNGIITVASGLGLSTIVIPANNVTYGDPCSGTLKRMYVQANYDLAGTPPAGSFLRVRVGGLPFRSLGLDESYSVDGYGDRFEYAATERLASSAANYDKDQGAISVKDINNRKSDNNKGKVHFLVLSHGPDRAGAVTRDGLSGVACAAGTADGPNCTPGLKAVYAIRDYSTTNKAVAANYAFHYDDVVKFYAATTTPLWRVANADGTDIRDLVDAESTGKIGVNNTNPTQTMDASGVVNTNISTTVRGNICDNTGGNCFTNGEIAKVDPAPSTQYNCPQKTGGAQPYASGFGADQANCASNAVAKCPIGSIMHGLKPDGSFDCQSVLSCASKTLDLCNISGVVDHDTLSPALTGVTLATKISGLSYRETWTCDSSGQWGRTSQTGICACNAYSGSENLGCPFGFTGTHTRNHTHNCPANTDTYSADNNMCVCTPTSKTDNPACGAGFSSGTITIVTPWVCDSSSAGHFDNSAAVTTNTCVCTAQADQTSTRSCPAGYSGSIDTVRSWTCPGSGAGSWSSFVDKPGGNHCVCVNGTPETGTLPCPAGQHGTDNVVHYFDCSSNSYGPWIEVSNTCSINLYKWVMTAPGEGGKTAPLAYQEGSSCTTSGQISDCSRAQSGSSYLYGGCECQ